MHARIDREHWAVVQVGCVLRTLILRDGRREGQGDQPQKGGGYCAAMSLNLGQFAASNPVFFVSISSLSNSTNRPFLGGVIRQRASTINNGSP
jgi:hypothetical protein